MPSSPSSVTSDERDSLVENPWADSAIAPHHDAEEAASKPPTHDARKVHIRTAHIRSHTTSGHPLYAPPSPNEQYDALSRGTSLDLHETRPSLRRAIKAGQPGVAGAKSDNIPERTSEGSEPQPKETDAEVIVHEIRPNDSLAGVALKYNVSIAALRSANKLWSSDSIHLRQVLYIPVQAVTAVAPLRSAFNTTSDACTQTFPHRRRSASEWDNASGALERTTTRASTAITVSARTYSTVKRVPLSELSFFPPPSTSSFSTSSRPNLLSTRAESSSSHTKPLRSHASALPRGSSAPTTPFFSGTSGGNRNMNGTPTLGLTTFLNGAKDEIMSRLSLDSMRGSSDAGEDPEVEMDVVRSVTALGQQNRNKGHDIRSWQRGTTPLPPAGWEREAVVLGSPRKSVTTIQLQPSPRMEIPATPVADKKGKGSEQSTVAVGPTSDPASI